MTIVNTFFAKPIQLDYAFAKYIADQGVIVLPGRLKILSEFTGEPYSPTSDWAIAGPMYDELLETDGGLLTRLNNNSERKYNIYIDNYDTPIYGKTATEAIIRAAVLRACGGQFEVPIEISGT